MPRGLYYILALLLSQVLLYFILAKQEHKKTWNNPQMYLKSGRLGPYYILHNFKATDELDNANLKTLKVAGMLKYKVTAPNHCVSCCGDCWCRRRNCK